MLLAQVASFLHLAAAANHRLTDNSSVRLPRVDIVTLLRAASLFGQTLSASVLQPMRICFGLVVAETEVLT